MIKSATTTSISTDPKSGIKFIVSTAIDPQETHEGMRSPDEDNEENLTNEMQDAPLPWLLEVNSMYSSLAKRGQKKRGPKIKRVFPWTIETQHDANVLKTNKTIFDGMDCVIKSLPKIDGIEMFRPDSPKLLMKSTVEKYKQLMLDEDLQAKASMAGETLTKAGQRNKAAAAHAGTEFLKMKKDLKSLKSTLRTKSANSVKKNDNGSNKGKNSIGKSITLERLDYTALGKKRRRRRRQLRAKSLPKLNRKLSPFRETH